MAGASRIFAIDVNEDKFEQAMSLGATEALNPIKYDKPIQQVLVGMTQWGVDYTYDWCVHARVLVHVSCVMCMCMCMWTTLTTGACMRMFHLCVRVRVCV